MASAPGVSSPPAPVAPATRPTLSTVLALSLILALGAAWATDPARGQDGRTDVAVLFNADLPASREVAEYYASRRRIPTNHCIGLPLTTSESISRSEFEKRLVEPLTAELKARALMATRTDIHPATAETPGRVTETLLSSRVRYLAVCYGVPLRVTEDPTLDEPGMDRLPELLRRNRAAVDAELTVLPLLLTGVARTGPIGNVWLGTTNALDLTPANGLFVVGRLDGPSPELARALVDRALEAEANGLLGRGYFDLRAATDPLYQNGDLWISNAWAVVTRYGFDTHLDREASLLPAGFPLSHVAFYAGWYSGKVHGPFAQPDVEFMPGAVAYHLHSFSAATLRSTNDHWVGPLVARGATATMGTVDEPYLDGTPDVGLCFARLLFSGFTWGEAVLASQRLLSWQLTVVGDPLYRPFSTHALDRAKDLAARGLGRFEWALLTLYNRKLQAGQEPAAVLAELEKEPRLRFSAVLQEKLADLQMQTGDPAAAAETYRRAALFRASPQQTRRLLWNRAEASEAAGKPADAYQALEAFAASPFPAPDPARLYERLHRLALALGKETEARRWKSELDRLKRGPNPK